MPEIRFEVALSAAASILATLGIPATPECLSRTAYSVLDAMYQAENRLVDQPPLLCGNCLVPVDPWAGGADGPCPRCNRIASPADVAGLN